ncbi:MAG TPA: hypothetical protein VIE65_17320 [Methylobacter sp.]|jgi:hypothetical protein
MLRLSFTDDQAAAKGFATGDIVRKAGTRDFVPTPYAGRVIYSNPATGKVHVQWPWGVQDESASELFLDVSGEVLPNLALDQWYSTWEGARLIDDETTSKANAKWRKSLSSKLADAWTEHGHVQRIIQAHEERTLPIWRAACHTLHYEISEIDAFRFLAAEFRNDFSLESIRLTVANIFEASRRLPPRLALYWKDNNRRYKVTKREKASGKFICPRCKGVLKPRTYSHGKRCLQCRTCGFSISPQDLVIDAEEQMSPEAV